MNRILLFSIALFNLYACKENSNNNDRQRPTPSIVNAVKAFCKENPGAFKNDVVNERANEAFRTALISNLNKGILNDYIFELRSVNEYSKNKFAAHFDMSYTNDDLYMNLDTARIHGDVIGLIDNSMVEKLANKSKYTLKCSFVKMLSPAEMRIYTNDMLWSPFTTIKNEAYSGPDVSLGFVLVNINEANQVKFSY